MRVCLAGQPDCPPAESGTTTAKARDKCAEKAHLSLRCAGWGELSDGLYSRH